MIRIMGGLDTLIEALARAEEEADAPEPRVYCQYYYEDDWHILTLEPRTGKHWRTNELPEKLGEYDKIYDNPYAFDRDYPRSYEQYDGKYSESQFLSLHEEWEDHHCPEEELDKVGNIDGGIYYYKAGTEILHREDGPAYECCDGGKEWYINGKLHREDGPAIESSNGGKFWYLHNKLHRTDGPAIEYADGHKVWFLNGEEVTEEDVMGTPYPAEDHEVDPCDYQVGGDHYVSQEVQPWEVMERVLTREEFIGFLKGNIIKYTQRRKGDADKQAEDMRKAKHYILKLEEMQ